MKSKDYKKIIGIVWLVLILSSCNTKSETYLEVPELIKPIEIKYSTTKPRIGNITTALRLDGYVMPAHTEEVSFECEDSKLKEIYVTLGQSVEKGELIAEIDTEAFKEAIVEKQKYIEKMKMTNEYTNWVKDKRKEILYLELEDLNKQLEIYYVIKESISDRTIETLKRNIELKRLEIETLELDISQGIRSQALDIELQQQALTKLNLRLLEDKLYATCSGVVVYIDKLQKGDRVTPFKTLVQIASTTELCVGYLGTEVFPNTIIEINLRIGDKNYKGIEVPKDSGISELNTMTEPRKIVIKDITPEVILGQYASIELVYKEKKDVLLVPYNCVVIEDRYVYVLENGKKVKKTVKIGNINPTEVEIVEGLTDQEDIFINTADEAYRPGSGTVLEVSRGDIVLYGYAQGKTMPSKLQELYFKYNSARLTNLNVSKGTKVQAGEPIATIELEDNALSIKTSQLDLEAQKKEYEDNKTLKLMDIQTAENELIKLQDDYERDYSLKIYPKRDLEKQGLQIELKKLSNAILKKSYESYTFEKEYVIEQAQINLEKLKEDTSHTTIKAPFDGIITELSDLKQMQLIDKNDRVATISSEEKPLITFSGISVTEVSYGMPVEISTFKNKFTGKIISCASILAEGSDSNGDAVIEIDDMGSSEISINGVTADIKVLEKEIKEVTIIDRKAVRKYNDREFVYLLEDGMKKQRFISTGVWDTNNCEVLSGLEVGEKVIVD